jgi:aminopeptidase N
MNKNRVAAVIAHEAAHHWFGNIVTCEWWDVAWLNEGYSRYLEYFGALMVEPDWELDLIYPVEQIHSVFQVDALTSTHPMTNEVNTPEEASAIFDNISYNKGSAIVRMMAHFIGYDRFTLATQDYLRDK